jgi:ribosomal protein L11 methyltransferase
VTARLPAAQASREAWAEALDRLEECGALLAAHDGVGGVELRDPRTIDGPQQPELVVYTTPEALEAVTATVRATLDAFGLGGGDVTAAVRTDDDWRDNWKQFYRPIVLGDGALLLRPSWIPRAPDHPTREIVIDPGRAFGTGLHETTQLCLDRICALWRDGARPEAILDLGCGSGILALAAARLFEATAKIVAIDEDPEATATTMENALGNRLDARLHVRTGDIHDTADRFDLVLANIRANTLVARAGALFEATAHEGKLVLSGVLVEELDEVEAEFVRAGFVRDASALSWPRRKDIWVALDFVRPR